MSKFFKKKRFYAEEFGVQMRGKRDAAPKKGAPQKKLSEYGRQLKEKQRVRFLYGVSEKQFKNLFEKVSRLPGIRGENLLIGLERRLDNVIYRLKLATTRKQSRQLVAHGHVFVNGQRVKAPSFQVSVGDKITISDKSLQKEAFVKLVLDLRMNRGIKVPEWLALHKSDHAGEVLRLPLRSEVTTPIEEHLIVELYSK